MLSAARENYCIERVDQYEREDYRSRYRGPNAQSENLGSGLGDSLILFTHTAADADRTDDLVAAFERDTACEDHDPPVIGSVNTEKLITRLAILGQVLCGDIECAGRPRLVEGNVDTADPCAVHTNVCDEIPATVDDRDIHRLFNFFGF
jgi:hypothetical protein